MEGTNNEAGTAVGIIPARYGSSRLPAKPLVELGGKPMIERVYLRACQARTLARVIVATDDRRIRDVIAPLGEVVMTRADHESGSDRVAEVAGSLDCDLIVNIQGDLPLLDPALIDALVEGIRADSSLDIATLAVPICDAAELHDPSVVKVVCSRQGRALYFSRAPLPYERDHPERWQGALHHVGIYAYRRPALLRFAALEPTPLERKEKLEQLRALENGIGIGVILCDRPSPMEVDTTDDIELAREALADLELCD